MSGPRSQRGSGLIVVQNRYMTGPELIIDGGWLLETGQCVVSPTSAMLIPCSVLSTIDLCSPSVTKGGIHRYAYMPHICKIACLRVSETLLCLDCSHRKGRDQTASPPGLPNASSRKVDRVERGS